MKATCDLPGPFCGNVLTEEENLFGYTLCVDVVRY